ncbi:MAG: hypothetical protein GY906_06440 [bacterium]|nr:hypothetical protein [bacterium]
MTGLPLSLAEIDRELEKLHVTKTQKQLIADMGEAVGVALDMSVATTRGFYAMAVITWQQQISMTAAETETRMSTAQSARIRTAEEILAIMREKILAVVRLQGKEHLLDAAIASALKLYTEKYSNRPQDTE